MSQPKTVAVREHSRAAAAPGTRSEPSKFATSATFAIRASKSDAEAYARALAPVLHRWCDRPVEVAKWLVHILEEGKAP
jgi:hypothetical protein